ncbi:hypothetical protein CEXT_27291 [Caerostris extrusa]|uniref:Uncharacterized protein n=1 Tax=Caerostris extrusa TaxID=172846 RepID=A0AAV4WUC4_CAEEX|nr:hypothetical protein CEXT_27291 [Caerostris extrusa]
MSELKTQDLNDPQASHHTHSIMFTRDKNTKDCPNQNINENSLLNSNSIHKTISSTTTDLFSEWERCEIFHVRYPCFRKPGGFVYGVRVEGEEKLKISCLLPVCVCVVESTQHTRKRTVQLGKND